MNATEKRAQEGSQRVRWIRPAIIAGIILVIVGGASAVLFHNLLYNYAADAAKPIERDLLSRGAVKKCSTGDTGRGLDNRQPWYKSYFELAASKEEAIATVKEVAAKGGYNLKQATPADRGHLGMADIYLDAYLFDNTKTSDHQDLENGPVGFAMGVNASGAQNACSKDSITVDAEHSVISIDVQMPNYKR